MAWNYTGDPSSSDKDAYRFHIGDTIEDEPVLQDEEIQFVLDNNSAHNVRLYLLFDKAALYFHRQIENKVGPIEEKPYQRAKYFEDMANHYYEKAYGVSIPSIKYAQPIFKVGMNDNRNGRPNVKNAYGDR